MMDAGQRFRLLIGKEDTTTKTRMMMMLMMMVLGFFPLKSNC